MNRIHKLQLHFKSPAIFHEFAKKFCIINWKINFRQTIFINCTTMDEYSVKIRSHILSETQFFRIWIKTQQKIPSDLIKKNLHESVK